MIFLNCHVHVVSRSGLVTISNFGNNSDLGENIIKSNYLCLSTLAEDLKSKGKKTENVYSPIKFDCSLSWYENI